ADWVDPAPDPSWVAPDSSSIQKIEGADGMLAERVALAQTLRLEELRVLAEALRPTGYRPVRLRPYIEPDGVRVAALWQRDGGDWRLAYGVSAEDLRRLDEQHRNAGFLAVDVAGYLGGAAAGGNHERYAALWVKGAGEGEHAQLLVGLTWQEHQATTAPYEDVNSYFYPWPCRNCSVRTVNVCIARSGTRPTRDPA